MGRGGTTPSLQQHAVVYVNSDDTGGRGFFCWRMAPTCSSIFINDVARDIQDPETHLTVWKRKAGQGDRRGEAGGQGESPQPGGLAHRRASDRAPTSRRFLLQHLGVPTLEHRLRRRGRERHLPLDLRRLLLSTRTSSTPTSPTAARWHRPEGTAIIRLGRPPTSCRSNTATSWTNRAHV